MGDRLIAAGNIENVSDLHCDSVVAESVQISSPPTQPLIPQAAKSDEEAELSENRSSKTNTISIGSDVGGVSVVLSRCDEVTSRREVLDDVSARDSAASLADCSSTSTSAGHAAGNTDDPTVCVTPPQARRTCVRNTPTLRSATREQVPDGPGNRRGNQESGSEKTARKELDVDAGLTNRQSLRVAEKKEIAANLKKRSKEEAGAGVLTLPTPEKSKRTREVWSALEKTVFFEALGEVGKNFDELRDFIAKKMSRKLSGSSDQKLEIRNRDQIRFFYYRSLNKISKFVHLDKDLKRYIRELYILINYGELRKRNYINLNERTGLKLNELVHKGSTTVRWRGKAHRVRTPVCRALKRINKIPENSADSENCKLPNRAVLELLPADNATWCRVQALAHNPRLRLSLPLQFRLHQLIKSLQRRWRTSEQRAMDEATSQTDVNVTAEGCPATTITNEEQFQVHLKLAPGFCLTPYTVQSAPPAPPLNLSLDSYYSRIREGAAPARSASAAAVVDSATANHADLRASLVDEWPRISFANVLDELCDRQEDSGCTGSGGGGDGSSSAGGTPAAAAAEGSVPGAGHQEQVAAERHRRLVMERSRRLLERGWTEETAQTFTVGELYMMVGRPARVRLLYRLNSREDSISTSLPEASSDLAPLSSLLAHLVAAARSVNAKDGSDGGLSTATTSAAATAPCARCTCKARAHATVTCGTQTPPMVAAASPMQDGRGIYYLPPSPPPQSKTESDWSASSSVVVTSSPGSNPARGAVSRVSNVGAGSSVCSATIMPPPSFTGAVRSVSRYRGRGGRGGCGRGQVVVQRLLPVMPRNSHHTGQLSMVNLQLAPSSDQQSSVKFATVLESGAPATIHQQQKQQTSHSFSVKIPAIDECDRPAKRASSPHQPRGTTRDKRRGVGTTSNPISKPSGWLNDSGAPYTESSISSSTDHVLTDVNFSANSNSSFTGFLASLVKNTSEEQASSSGLQEQTSPTAGAPLLNEIGDLSLSSFLGHLDMGSSRNASSNEPLSSKNDLGVGGGLSSKIADPTTFSFGDKNGL